MNDETNHDGTPRTGRTPPTTGVPASRDDLAEPPVDAALVGIAGGMSSRGGFFVPDLW